MMSELVRMSLFCDINEMLTDDYTHIQTKEHTPSPRESVMDTGDMCSSPQNINTETELLQNSNCENRLSEPEMMTCNKYSPSAIQPFDQMDLATAGAKVDISTFLSVHPDDVFGNDYLHTIVHPIVKTEENRDNRIRHSAKTDIKVRKRATKKAQPVYRVFNLYQEYGDRVIVRPPYPYTALTAAAIFLSENSTVTRPEILESISKMFEVFRVQIPRWQRKWRKRALKRDTMREKELFILKDGQYGLNYSLLDPNIFKKIDSDVPSDETAKFADDLFAELGVPEKMEELRKVVEREKDQQGKRKIVVAPKQPTWEAKSKTSASLKLPPRPCFVDESSSDSLQMSLSRTNTIPITHAPQETLPGRRDTPQQQSVMFSPTNVVYFLSTSSFGSYATIPVVFSKPWV